jgi:(S)-ureidoglycine aminohydrolase
MEISTLTRSVVHTNHAVITPDGYVNSHVPGWENCTVHVIINEGMGASFCQTMITAKDGAKLSGKTKSSQIFFYIIEGEAKATIGEEVKYISSGQFVYVPIEQTYSFDAMHIGTQILTFHKEYEKLDGFDIPNVIYGGDVENTPSINFLGDTALRLKVLLPDNLAFDMAINIFTYDSGGHLPFVETHIMEHGLMFLQGQGVYMLGQNWYPVKKGDSIWMGPYCNQWFTAMGKEPAVYIYYKNVNRHPYTV